MSSAVDCTPDRFVLTDLEVRQAVGAWRMERWKAEWPELNDVARELHRLRVDERTIGLVLDRLLKVHERPPMVHEVTVEVERRTRERSPADRVRADWPHLFAGPAGRTEGST